MKLFDDLKRAEKALSKWQGAWAVCGGVAAAIYRDTPRYTADLDIALIDHPSQSAKAIAEHVAGELGFVPKAGWVCDQKGHLIPSQALIIGRNDLKGSYVGIDFLLPILPWIAPAVARAQANLLDYGFAKLPTITPEDLILAKLYAYQGTPTRTTDLDDLISISGTIRNLDKDYLRNRVAAFELHIPARVAELLAL